MFSKYFAEAMGVLLGHGLAKLPWAPKIVFSKALLPLAPGHVLPESCLKALSLIRSLSVTPKKQHTKISVQLSKAVLVLPALRREEKNFSETVLESTVQWKRQEASGPFPDFPPAWIYTQPLGQFMQKLLRWFEFHKEL